MIHGELIVFRIRAHHIRAVLAGGHQASVSRGLAAHLT